MDEIMCDVPGLAAAIWEEREREEFEAWFSDEWQHPEAVERDAVGYKLAAAQDAWTAWQAGWRAALANVANAIALLQAEIERLQAEVERLQKAMLPRREDECLTLDHWRMRAYHLEEGLSNCSRACANEQGKREQAETRAKQLAEELRKLEEREQRDEALLRQALEVLEELQYAVVDTAKTDDMSMYYRAIAALSAALAEPTCKPPLQVAERQGPEHIKDPETGAEVWVHKELQ